jgi:predicted DNA-binding transcriptional regulator YafY
VRADRLLSLLMLLQTRGQMTAQQLAGELEVSPRTICRDIDALSAAGVPVYGVQGRGGGYALLDHYRTTLTGLTEAQVRALFMLSIPAPLRDLGVSEALKAALLKLSASLPGARQETGAEVRQRIHLDAAWWFQGAESVPHLHALHDAVWDDRRVRIRWPVRHGLPQEIEQVVDAYGLVAKAGVWYLVCGIADGDATPRITAHRISRLLAAEVLDRRFERPARFDLAAWWRGWCTAFESNRPAYPVVLAVAPHALVELARRFAAVEGQIERAGLPQAGGWLTVEIVFESLYDARERLLPLGGAVEVLAPRPLRLTMADYAAQIAARYTPPDEIKQ